MDTSTASPPPRDPTPGRGDPGWFDWIWAHRKPRPGLERHTIPVQLFDPIPPDEPRPELLLKSLTDGDVLPLERVEVPGRPSPAFVVRTAHGRDLGRLPEPIAGLVELARTRAVEMEVSVFSAMWYFPPETALQLLLEFVVWCRADDWVEYGIHFRFDPSD